MSKEAELSDEQIDCCVGNLGMAENSILAGPDEIRRAMRAAIAADRDLRRGDAEMPSPALMMGGGDFFTADQMHEYAQAALAAQAMEIEGLRNDAERLTNELMFIANADVASWDDPSEFKAWAQNRARAAKAKEKAK